MFPGGYFAKTYFAGTYWTPADGGSIIPVDESSNPYRIVMRVRRGR
jgi:hypothetical protein